MKQKRGFTLVELLVVIAILSALAAIICPVFASARRDARKATSISNLRQCGLALTMYCYDNGGFGAMPTAAMAAQVLKTAPTCDPNDQWRTSCSEVFGQPLIGSYAYVRYASPGPNDWSFLLHRSNNPTVMLSIFYADPVPSVFQGVSATPDECVNHGDIMPGRVLRLRLDGSVGFTKPTVRMPDFTWCFSWENLFADDGPIVSGKPTHT